MNRLETVTQVADTDYERLSEIFIQEALKITENCHPECVVEIYHELWTEYASMN